MHILETETVLKSSDVSILISKDISIEGTF